MALREQKPTSEMTCPECGCNLDVASSDQIDYATFGEATTFFAFSKLDEKSLSEQDPSLLAMKFMSEVLQWFIGFLLHGTTGRAKSLAVGYKRLLAMCYILRPDMLDGKTLKQITSELNECRNSLSRWTAELSYMFGFEGVNQKEFRSRAVFHAAQLHDWDETKRDELPKTFEQFVKRNQELEEELEEMSDELQELRELRIEVTTLRERERGRQIPPTKTSGGPLGR